METAVEFRRYLRKYIDDHNCHGRNTWTWDEEGGSLSRFVPRRALAEFWTRQKILDVLCAPKERIMADYQLILEKYLVVFSIIMDRDPPRPETIKVFLSSETPLDDSHLPITSTPTDFSDDPEKKEILEEFQKRQWKFCPLTFDQGRQSMLNLNPEHIVPIVTEKLIDDTADKELDDVLVYEAVWHPDCIGDFLPPKVIHKVYHNRDGKTEDMCRSEIDLYTSFQDNTDAFDHIVQYFGSFVVKDRVTLILEYADGGDLASYLERTPHPPRPKDRLEFWGSFFQLLKALNATHNLTPSTPDTNKYTWHLRGIHQDIRPQNILIKESNSSDYRVHFLLTDFGTGHVRKHRAAGIDPMGAHHKGNGMYSAPESRRDDRVSKPQLCEGDIWSLGGVASELLVWSIQGPDKRRRYQQTRSEATRKTGLAGGFHEGAFHDGECRLDVVDDQHESVLEMIGSEDVVSPIVSKIILDCMLVANPTDRWCASQVFQQWNHDTQNLVLQERRPTRHSYRSSRSTLSMIGSPLPTLRDPQSPQTPPANTHQWFSSDSAMSMEPGPLSVSRRQTSTAAEAVERESLTRITRSPSLFSQQPQWSTNGAASSSRGPIRRPPPTSRLSTPPHRANRSTVDELYKIPDEIPIDSPMEGQEDHSVQLMNGLAISPLFNPPRSNPTSSHPTPGRRQRPEPSLPVRETSLPKWPGRYSVSNDPIITIDDLYNRYIGNGKAAWYSLKKSKPSKQELYEDYPSLGRDLDQLKGNTGRDQIFLIDDSFSMKKHKYQIAKTVRILARVLKIAEVDPDETFKLYWASTKASYSFKHAQELQDNVEKNFFSSKRCDIYSIFEFVTEEALRGQSPVSIYILTNGRWNCSNPNNAEDICKLNIRVRDILTKNRQQGRLSQHIGIQFIRFYQPGDAEDEIGKKRLQYLDDRLAETLTDLDPGIVRRDIIDTRDWDDSICKMLLGGVFPDEDKS